MQRFHHAVPQRGLRARATQHRDKIELLAKIGWLAKGGLYLTLGILAFMAAIGEGGAVEGGQGVLQWVARQPFGTFLLVVAGIGFIGYALWRFVEAAIDPERHKSKKEMIAKRIGWALSGIVHGALAVAAFQMVAGSGGRGGAQTWLGQAMQSDAGAFLVGVLGVFVIGVGLYQFKKAIELGFMEDVDTQRMSAKERKAFRIAGRVGLAARGVVFPIIGYFLIKAAANASPSQARDVGGALHEIAEAGWLPLAIIALGLAAYGVLQFFFARYRHVHLT